MPTTKVVEPHSSNIFNYIRDMWQPMTQKLYDSGGYYTEEGRKVPFEEAMTGLIPRHTGWVHVYPEDYITSDDKGTIVKSEEKL